MLSAFYISVSKKNIYLCKISFTLSKFCTPKRWMHVFEVSPVDFFSSRSIFCTVSRDFRLWKKMTPTCIVGLRMLRSILKTCVQPTRNRVLLVASLGAQHLAISNALQNTNEYPSLWYGTEGKMGGICRRHGAEGKFIHNFYLKTWIEAVTLKNKE